MPERALFGTTSSVHVPHNMIYCARSSDMTCACSRAYIRFACGDDELPVPSPTYLLLNTYEDEVIDGPPIHHLDLYRLSKASSELRLDIPSLLATGSALFEWPDRLRTAPDRHVEMHMYPLRPVCSCHVPQNRILRTFNFPTLCRLHLRTCATKTGVG